MIVVSLNREPDFLLKGIKITLNNFKNILTEKNLHFLDYLRNSFIIASISSLFSVLIASLSAYAITRIDFPFRYGFLLLSIAISMFPQITLVSYLFKFMLKLNLINTYPALIFPYISWSLPLSLWILTSFFMKIPKELDEAGMIDGCTRFNVLSKIIFPVALPGIFSTAILCFIFSFNDFLFALILTTDYHARTIPVGIAMFQGLHGEIPWGNIMSASTISTLPVILLTILFQKKIILNLTQGSLKG